MTGETLGTPLDLFENIEESVAFIRSHLDQTVTPRFGLILGSGLGSFADHFEPRVAIDYREIPHFPVSSVQGHAGLLVIGRIAGAECVAMQGRVHFYEGYPLAKVTFPARCMIQLGARTLIVTNAAGGIGKHLDVGNLMVIRDFINLAGANPLHGHNDDRLGPRFPDMTEAFAPALQNVAHQAARSLGFELEEGVYAGLAGPSYETPAEIEMLRRLGADAVGMSTVPETIVANHMGAEVLGISCISNLAAGTTGAELSHDEVTEVTNRIQSRFVALLTRILGQLAES